MQPSNYTMSKYVSWNQEKFMFLFNMPVLNSSTLINKQMRHNKAVLTNMLFYVTRSLISRQLIKASSSRTLEESYINLYDNTMKVDEVETVGQDLAHLEQSAS